MPLDALVTGRIATLRGDAGFGWVEAVGITGGRVAFAGSAVDLETRADPFTVRFELDHDEVAIPGLTDAHLHLTDAALAFEEVDLAGSATLRDGLDLVAAAHARLERGAWLLGSGWDSDRWHGWPAAADLERVAPGRPVALWAHDHHAMWLSPAALAAAGIDATSSEPAGGRIGRTADGQPSGVLHESATRLVMGQLPVPEAADIERLVVRVAQDLVRLGLVALHDPGPVTLQPGLGPAFAAYASLADRGRLPLRVHACAREEQLEAAIAAGLRSGQPIGPAESRLRFGWLKLFADGTLGSRTAALLEPIVAEPERPLPPGAEHGLFVTPPERLTALAARAASAGIATMIHAIGDAAVRAGLDALEPLAAGAPLMPRLEHVQLCHPDDRPRFGRSGIAASVQPIHLRADAQVARLTWGARAEPRGYAWRSLAAAGAMLAFGTDAPVEPADPWPGLAMAVTRADPSWSPGTPPFGPDEALPLDQALRAACIGPAVTAREADRGRLIPGQRADLVVLPAAALDESVEPGGPLATARPRLVLVDGAVAYED